MKRFRWASQAAAFLACIGILVPRLDVLASEAAPAPVVQDVAQTPAGEVTGMVISATGQPLEAARVTFAQGENVAAETMTDQQGLFRVSGLRGGVYSVTAGQGSGFVRVWSAHTAPPNAHPQLILVSGETVRSQGEFFGLDIVTLWLLTAATGALVVSIVSLNRIGDVEDKVDALQSP